MTKAGNLILYCDGAARGNPGPGSYGFVLMKESSVIFEEGKKLGVVTNNVAEYTALVAALLKSRELGAHAVTVRSDSELMIRQLKGLYKVKAVHLKPLFEKAKALLSEFETFTLEHVRREDNTRADELANLALDSGQDIRKSY